MNDKSVTLLTIFVLFIISSVLLFLGFNMNSFWTIIIGIGTSILFLWNLLLCLTKGYYDLDLIFDYNFTPGCILIIFICASSWIFNWDYERYIAPKDNDLQHLYMDCQHISGSREIKEVSALEGFFNGTFKDCKTCINRLEKDRKEAKEREEQENRQKSFEYAIKLRDEMIKYYSDKLEKLNNCTDIDYIGDCFNDYIQGVRDITMDEFKYIHII